MSHPDPTTLALAALGESVPEPEHRHITGCAQCTAEVADLAGVVDLAREAPQDLPAVPDSVWAGIRAELALDRAAQAPGQRAATAARTLTIVGGPAHGPRHAAAEPEPATAEPARVVPLAPRRRRTLALVSVAAMAGAVVGGSVVWASLERPTGVEPSATLVAQAVLDPLSPSVGAPGTAEVLSSDDGLVVRVDARSLPESTGFYEVWLLDSGTTKLVALGALPSGSVGTFTIPPGVSVSDFPIVDISLEPYDGDPGHSHDSLMRGTLEA